MSTFSLSAYEETKQRMRQLQQQKKAAQEAAASAAAAAAAAAATTSSEAPSSSSSASRPGLSRQPSSSQSSRDTTGAVTRGDASASSVSRVTPSLSRASSARSHTTSTSNITTAAGAASSKTPLSPRQTSTNNGWVNPSSNPLSAIPTHEKRGSTSLDSTSSSADRTLITTAPFNVSVLASPITSPRHSSLTGAQPSIATSGSSVTDSPSTSSLSAPQVPPSPRTFSTFSDDGGVFASKLASLSQSLQQTIESLGLKYSLDARMKVLLHEVEAAHNSALKQAHASLANVREQWNTAQSQYNDAQNHYQTELIKQRAAFSERLKTMERNAARANAKAAKEFEANLRVTYLEKEKKFEGIEKYNEQKMKTLESSLRQQIRNELNLEARKSKQAEGVLQEQIEKLETQAQTLLMQKEDEATLLKKQIAELENRVRDLVSKERVWDKKVSRMDSEKNRMQEEVNLHKVELAQMRTEAIALRHQITRAQEATAAAEADSSAHQSRLSNSVMDAIAERDAARLERDQLAQALNHAKEMNATAIQGLKQKHALELDTIQARISAVLTNKDEQIQQLKGKIQAQNDKMKEIERELLQHV